MPDLEGRTALVTGANSGLGLETSVLLAQSGARVLMACRNPGKAEAAASRVCDRAEVVTLDLASLASVAEAAEQVGARTGHLDILVNNAGLMAVDEARTVDGFEMQFGVNHLGHFALTAALMPQLLASERARVVNVSSFGHRAGVMNFDDLMFEHRPYDRWRPYFQSKLANLLFTRELERRLRRAGTPAQALAAHPGNARTNLGHVGHGFTNSMMRPSGWLAQPARIGALPLVRAAADPEAKGGEFYGPHLQVAGYPVLETPSRRARNQADAERLWEVSEKLTGVQFNLP